MQQFLQIKALLLFFQVPKVHIAEWPTQNQKSELVKDYRKQRKIPQSKLYLFIVVLSDLKYV